MTDQHRGDSQITIPAHVEDLAKFKGLYLRNIRTDKVVQVLEVGTHGVTAQEVTPNDYGGQPYGEPHGITWLAIQRIYNIMVDAHQIDGVH